METSAEEMINPVVRLRRNSDSNTMSEGRRISINDSVCDLQYSELLYRLTDSSLSTVEKIRNHLEYRN